MTSQIRTAPRSRPAPPDPPGEPPGRAERLVRTLLADRRIRYLLVGGIAATVYYGVFSAGWLLSGGAIPYLAMAVLANAVCTVTTYPLYRRGVFRAAGPWLPGLAKFYVICLWSLAFTLAGMPLLVEIADLPVLLSQAIIIVVSPLINYQMNKYWAFRR